MGRDVGRWIPAAPVGWPWTSEPAAGASTAWGGVLGAAPRGSSPSPGAGGGFFRQAPALMLCLQDGDIETAQGLSAEKAALSTVGFYTNKKKIISTIAEWGVCQPWGGVLQPLLACHQGGGFLPCLPPLTPARARCFWLQQGPDAPQGLALAAREPRRPAAREEQGGGWRGSRGAAAFTSAALRPYQAPAAVFPRLCTNKEEEEVPGR